LEKVNILWGMLTGVPGHWLGILKKEVITKKMKLFDFLWINYTNFNTITTI